KYLLLRDNRESGPHAIEHMGSIGLHPLDLVWIENESTSWKYPEEIEELRDLVTHDATSFEVPRPSLSTEKVFVSLPPDNDEGQAQTITHQSISRSVEDTLIREEENDIQPAPEFIENYRTPKKKQPIWQPRLFKANNAASVITIFIGVVLGSFVIKKWVDGYVPADEETATVMPVIDHEVVNQQDESVHNALVTEVVPVLKTTAVKKTKKVNLKSQLRLATNNYKVGLFGGINGLQLTVFNASSQSVDKVIVALDYLKPNGSVVESETVPFTSIKPRAAQTLSIPGSNRGVKVRYKILKVYAHDYKDDLKQI
ncbi:MAG: hypothetical protein ACXVBH_05655, partial [Flavisolibacter sp.]